MSKNTPNQQGLTRIVFASKTPKRVYGESIVNVRVNGETQQENNKVLLGYEVDLTLENGLIIKHDLGSNRLSKAKKALERLLTGVYEGRVAINNKGWFYTFKTRQDLNLEIAKEKGVNL
jgi:competence protein ComGF